MEREQQTDFRFSRLTVQSWLRWSEGEAREEEDLRAAARKNKLQKVERPIVLNTLLGVILLAFQEISGEGFWVESARIKRFTKSQQLPSCY